MRRMALRFNIRSMLIAIFLIGIVCSIGAYEFDRINRNREFYATLLETFLVSKTIALNAIPDTSPTTGDVIYLITPPATDSSDVATVQRQVARDNQPALAINFNLAGAKKIGRCHNSSTRPNTRYTS